jgi:hypothetical protein
MSANGVLVKRPLVRATRTAIEQATSILPVGAVLENQVTALIAAGRCRRVRGDADFLWVWGDGWRARAVRVWSHLNPERKGWLVVSVADAATSAYKNPSRPLHVRGEPPEPPNSTSYPSREFGTRHPIQQTKEER